ncbi:MAG: hypothetical protein QNJ18_16750 [Xenococcaceae cyanobacterium MO_167.B52]|nr:hypothetical protein [Xenococcaceae cyanobacterium MO_167.B52]
MQYQEFTQENPKVIPFDLDQNIPKSNSQISLIGDKVNNSQDSESPLIVGLSVILALAYIIGLVFVLTNLIVKVIIKAYQDTQVSSEFYEQTKDLMRFDFEESSCLV